MIFKFNVVLFSNYFSILKPAGGECRVTIWVADCHTKEMSVVTAVGLVYTVGSVAARAT